jgi:hypothetical protein
VGERATSNVTAALRTCGPQKCAAMLARETAQKMRAHGRQGMRSRSDGDAREVEADMRETYPRPFAWHDWCASRDALAAQHVQALLETGGEGVWAALNEADATNDKVPGGRNMMRRCGCAMAGQRRGVCRAPPAASDVGRAFLAPRRIGCRRQGHHPQFACEQHFFYFLFFYFCRQTSFGHVHRSRAKQTLAAGGGGWVGGWGGGRFSFFGHGGGGRDGGAADPDSGWVGVGRDGSSPDSGSGWACGFFFIFFVFFSTSRGRRAVVPSCRRLGGRGGGRCRRNTTVEKEGVVPSPLPPSRTREAGRDITTTARNDGGVASPPRTRGGG